MADVLALLIVAVVVMAGASALSFIARVRRRRAAELRRDAPRRLREDLRDTDAYIKQVSKALSEDDLDSIESRRKEGP